MDTVVAWGCCASGSGACHGATVQRNRAILRRASGSLSTVLGGRLARRLVGLMPLVMAHFRSGLLHALLALCSYTPP